MTGLRRIFEAMPRVIGLDHRGEQYAYGHDPRFGLISRSKIPQRWVRTTCGYCSVGCGLFLGVTDGRPVSVKGDPDHPVNYGKLCPKGLSEHESITAEGRALHPLWRQAGSFPHASFFRQPRTEPGRTRGSAFTPISWNDALNGMAATFRDIQRRYGPDSVAVISTGQLVTEEFYTLGKLVRLGLKARNYDSNTTLCMATAVSGYKRSFGSDGPPGSYEDFALADCVLLIGANIADNHPILTCWLDANPDPRRVLIVADPRVTKTAMMADLHLSLKPRTDIDLLNGMMHILIRENIIDAEYIEHHTSGFKELAASLEPFTPELVAERTGLNVEAILAAARAYGRASRAMIAWTMGVNHSDQGTETVNAINNLALLTGKVGRPGSSPLSITGQCNAMGMRESGFTSSMPGYRRFEDPTARKELAAIWKIPEEHLPTERGLAYPDIIEEIVHDRIKALWVIGTNPFVSYPNRPYLENAVSRLEFLVVQDGFHPTPTTERADLVLPSAIWGEKEGTYTNTERRVSKVNRAVDPPGQARTDFEIFLDLAHALGVADELFPGWTKPEDAWNEWRRVSQGTLCDVSGISYALLHDVGGVQWPHPIRSGLEELDPPASDAVSVNAPGSILAKRLYTDGRFPTPDGRARLLPVKPKPMPEEPNSEYPLLLNTGRTVEHWHTRTKTGRIAILERLSPQAWIEMNPIDAELLGLTQGDYVAVRSRRGIIKRIALRITEIVAPGQIFIPFHWQETNANNLTLDVFDPISREPNYKQCAVRVERLE